MPRSLKLEFILRLKIKRNDWLLCVRKQQIIALYFESETYSSVITSRLGVLTVLPGREEVVSFRLGWSTGHSIKNPDH